MKEKKLLFVGGSKSVHTFNLLALIQDYFDESLLITDAFNTLHKDVKQILVAFSLKNPSHLLSSTIKIRRIIKNYKPDFIVILQVDTAAFFTTIANREHIPSLIIGMGSDILITPKKNCLYKFMAKYVLNNNKYYNTGARYVAKKMQEIIKKDVDVVVANFGFNSNIVPKQKQNIIYSNRLHKPLYRIDKIIRSFAIFVKKHNDWTLVVAANGDEQNLTNLVKQLHIEDKVKFVGWLNSDENNNYYAISKIWVSIPESDCTPISLMEAMAGECIPIVSDLPTMHEWINNKENGIIANNLEEDFFSVALDLDYDSVVKINKNIVENYGSKEKNRKKFYSIFDKEFKRE